MLSTPALARISRPRPVLAGLCCLALMLAACGKTTASALPADALWTAQLIDLADRPATLASFRGRPLVVNFWARWCPPCRAEIPDLIKTRAQFADQGVEFLGIALEDDVQPVSEFAKRYGINYPMFLARNQGEPLMSALGNRENALPFTVVIDRRGNIVARKVGRISHSEAEAAVRTAIE